MTNVEKLIKKMEQMLPDKFDTSNASRKNNFGWVRLVGTNQQVSFNHIGTLSINNSFIYLYPSLERRLKDLWGKFVKRHYVLQNRIDRNEELAKRALASLPVHFNQPIGK